MFHVVHIKFNDKHRHYEIWRNNKPNRSLKLKKHQAYRICAILNEGM